MAKFKMIAFIIRKFQEGSKMFLEGFWRFKKVQLDSRTFKKVQLDFEGFNKFLEGSDRLMKVQEGLQTKSARWSMNVK